MTDAEYLFRQDIKEKKAAGRGRFHKKSGAKSKKCTLPSDRLTKKQRERLNGKVMTFNPNHFYSWEQFKEFSDDLQLKYINHLISKYDVGTYTISRVLFKRGGSLLTNHFTRKDLLKYVNGQDVKHPLDKKYAFIEAIEKATATSNSEEEEHLDNKEDPITVTYEVKKEEKTESVPASIEVISDPVSKADKTENVEISDFLIRMNKFDDNTWNIIKTMFGDQKVNITISVMKG